MTPDTAKASRRAAVGSKCASSPAACTSATACRARGQSPAMDAARMPRWAAAYVATRSPEVTAELGELVEQRGGACDVPSQRCKRRSERERPPTPRLVGMSVREAHQRIEPRGQVGEACRVIHHDHECVETRVPRARARRACERSPRQRTRVAFARVLGPVVARVTARPTSSFDREGVGALGTMAAASRSSETTSSVASRPVVQPSPAAARAACASRRGSTSGTRQVARPTVGKHRGALIASFASSFASAYNRSESTRASPRCGSSTSPSPSVSNDS